MEVKVGRYEAHKTERQLGVRLAMEGTDIKESAYRLTQTKAFAGKIWSLPFTRLDAETTYRERRISSMGYCLPITQYSDTQCDKIQSPFITAVLAKMGLNRDFPHAVVFGSKKYQSKQLDD